MIASLLALLALGGAGSASAEMPWWHLSEEGRPANVRPGSAQDGVQEVTVSATGGSYTLLERKFGLEGVEGPISEEFNFNASDQEMREGLERIFGANAVEVTGGPGDATGSKPYVIKFVGSRADQPIEQMYDFTSLSGGAEESVAKSVDEGRADGALVVVASNLGDKDVQAQSSPLTITDELPPGLAAVRTEAMVGGNHQFLKCAQPAGPCTWSGAVPSYDSIEMVTYVNAQAGAKSGETNEAKVSGGGLPEARLRQPVVLNDAPVTFNVQKYEMNAEEEGGALDTQAGSHPFQLTTDLSLNQESDALRAPEMVKDLNFRLPPGLIGNPTQFPQCTDSQFEKGMNGSNECPPDTVVGVASVKAAAEALGRGILTFVVPVFNLKPSVGEPARFAFSAEGNHIFLDTSVRTGEDYGVTVSVKSITQEATLLESQVTFWGVPGDPRHDGSRGWSCVDGGRWYNPPEAPCGPLNALSPPPLLSMPTSCTGPLHSSVQADSWEHQGVFGTYPTSEAMQALDGCNRLPFDPSITVAPDGPAGSTPSGLTVGIHVPQDLVLNATALSESNVKDTTVALPAGVALNPAAADGLEACSEEQVSLGARSVPACPDASKVGTVSIKSPLLPNALEGSVYLAAQDANPFGSLIALYIVAQDPISGTIVKVAGEVKPDPVTGQLVSTFDNTPQLPFEDLELHFFGGDRAPLGTPAQCGTYTTGASIAPWSGNPSSNLSSSFQITSGPGGSSCSDPLPFAPSLTAGSTNIQAGAFSPFTMTMSRPDGQQSLKGVQLRMPPGLLGTLSSVKLCEEPQADAGTCGPESLIGETVVSVGLGGDPYSVRGGRVYITGPYEGAPYGLSIVNPAKAGPFDLGQVIVRARIEVDPLTAVLTISTDTSGPYAIPQILDGIPLQIQHVNVVINRPDFTFNPTNCSRTAIAGALTSGQGATAALSVPFQVTNCATLAFKPQFKVSTAGKTSRANGASLDVKLAYPKAPWGSQANIKSVKVDLPKQLPSRLTTLQKACPDATFNRNPASCPPGSRIGSATATTPIIPVGLSGPAYFVSHGGAKFPELVIVLSGYGVTVQLHGETFINSAGITSSTFRSIPDVPIGVFELKLPQGKGSALAANGNLCTSTLRMPTTFTAQNGMVIKQSTPISPTGCAKHKAKRKVKAKPKGKVKAKHKKKR
ncbi:MAG TPA: hypothetical protein VK781_06790 [Solirubrobacteraceae bacterium]|nr:hypothetical protein [Solirubrobacteraceae bacterium]